MVSIISSRSSCLSLSPSLIFISPLSSRNRHWPIGLLYDYHTSNRASTSISNSTSNSTSYFPTSSNQSSTSPIDFFHIKLHLQSPPLEKIGSTLGNTPLQVARTAFMSMLKEADFVRYGSTRRVGNLRKREQEILWEGVVDRESSVVQF